MTKTATKIGDQVRIVYICTLNDRKVFDDIENGTDTQDIVKDIKRFGIRSDYIIDSEIDEVELL